MRVSYNQPLRTFHAEQGGAPKLNADQPLLDAEVSPSRLKELGFPEETIKHLKPFLQEQDLKTFINNTHHQPPYGYVMPGDATEFNFFLLNNWHRMTDHSPANKTQSIRHQLLGSASHIGTDFFSEFSEQHTSELFSFTIYALLTLREAASNKLAEPKKTTSKQMISKYLDVLISLADEQMRGHHLGEGNQGIAKDALQDQLILNSKMPAAIRKEAAKILQNWDEHCAKGKETYYQEISALDADEALTPSTTDAAKFQFLQELQQAQAINQWLHALEGEINPRLNQSRKQAWDSPIETIVGKSHSYQHVEINLSNTPVKKDNGEYTNATKFLLGLLADFAQDGRKLWALDFHQLREIATPYTNWLAKQSTKPENILKHLYEESQKFFTKSTATSFRDFLGIDTRDLPAEVLNTFDYIDALKKQAITSKSRITVISDTPSDTNPVRDERLVLLGGTINVDLNHTYTVKHQIATGNDHYIYGSPITSRGLLLLHPKLSNTTGMYGNHFTVGTECDEKIYNLAYGNAANILRGNQAHFTVTTVKNEEDEVEVCPWVDTTKPETILVS